MYSRQTKTSFITGKVKSFLRRSKKQPCENVNPMERKVTKVKSMRKKWNVK